MEIDLCFDDLSNIINVSNTTSETDIFVEYFHTLRTDIKIIISKTHVQLVQSNI